MGRARNTENRGRGEDRVLKRSTPEARNKARRALLLWFAMFGRDYSVRQGAKIFAEVVGKQEGSELPAANAVIEETSRLLDAEDERFKRLLNADDADLLAAAKLNMIGFDPTRPVASPAVAALLEIDAAIHSIDNPHQYFPYFVEEPLFKQSHVLERLIVASGDHADINTFTEHLFGILRRSRAYVPSVHGKLQQQFRRVRKPICRHGRPATVGNEMLTYLIRKAIHDIGLPKSTAAKIVQEITHTVLCTVWEGQTVVRRQFVPTDAAIKKIVERL